MHSDPGISVPQLLSGGLALLLLGLSCWLAFEVARRVRPARAQEALRWLAGAAFALGTGHWASWVLAAQAGRAGGDPRYEAWLMAAAWMLAVAAAAAGIGLAGSRAATPGRLAAGAVTLGTGFSVSQALWTWSLDAHSAAADALAWPLVVASIVSSAGAWTALRLIDRLGSGDTGRWQQGLATGTLTAALLPGQWTLLQAAGPAAAVPGAGPQGAPLANLTPLAAIGVGALLVFMLICSHFEQRLRASLRRAKSELQQQAFTDALTELPNRVTFEGTLADMVRGADRTGERIALLFINIDGFKAVNESLGHRSGDRILREAAERLKGLASAQRFVGRLGADEFMLLAGGHPGNEDISRLALQVRELMSRPITMGGREIGLACSIGIAVYPEHGGLSTLMAHANAAMRAAKSIGGGGHCFFEQRMMNDAREQMELLRDLKAALAKGQLELYYQPKIHGPSGEITGAEALMRWHHPQRGMLGPGVFIPIAERYGLIGALGNWVIEEAPRQIRQWREAGLRMRVAINLSVHQLRQADLVDRIAAALEANKVNPQLLTCEITESVAMGDAEGTVGIFDKLKAVGVHISIDDFGTGYSSLSYLCKLSVDELKIDRSFVLDLEGSSDARAVVDAVVKLGQTLGMKVVAEGVERQAQHEILRGLGCDELQGYLFAKPMSARSLALWAMTEEGPRALQFRDSLFKNTMPAVAE
jgi:diguanylate cyclase (GGDEF)-like protein